MDGTYDDSPAAVPAVTARLRGLRLTPLATAIAVGVHVAVFWLLASSIRFSPDFGLQAEAPPDITVLQRFDPPPPDVRSYGSGSEMVALPDFKPRVPRQVREGAGRAGDPRLAIWRYLCNRDTALVPATGQPCPAPDFSMTGLAGDMLAPLNRRGDSGAMLGSDTVTMSLEEAGVAKGWIRPRPRTGQDQLSGATDQSGVPAASSLAEDLPQLSAPAERTAGD